MLDPILPEDWKERIAQFRPDASERFLTGILQEIVSAHGDKSLFMDSIQSLALSACGIMKARNVTLYPLAGFNAMIEAAGGGEWVLSDPVQERLREKQFKNSSSIVDAEEKVRGILDEWRVLDVLIGAGFVPVRHQRQSGCDWIVRKNAKDLKVEVKGKAPIDNAFQSLHAFWEGLMLLPASRGLRRFEWEWDLGVDDTRMVFLAKRQRMAMLVDALASWATRLSCWLGEADQVGDLSLVYPANSHALGEGDLKLEGRCYLCDQDAHLDVSLWSDGCLRASISVCGRPWGGRQRVYCSAGGYAQYVLTSLSEERIQQVVDQLSGLIVGRGPRAGKKLKRAKGEWMFAVLWPVPFWWDGVLERDSTVLRRVVEGVTARVDAVVPGTPVALYAETLSKGLRRWVLNEAAQGMQWV